MKVTGRSFSQDWMPLLAPTALTIALIFGQAAYASATSLLLSAGK